MSGGPAGQSSLSAVQRRKVLRSVLILMAVIAVFVGLFVNKLTSPVLLSSAELKKQGAFLFDNPRSFKDFSLLDFHNEPFTPANLAGKWSMVFFGFTYCPDICPTTMALLNRFYRQQQTGPFAADLQVVMVTVDPARDSPEVLLPYVSFFNPDFIGVTGEFLNLHRFATQLNIPFSKVPGGGENYQMSHSSNVAIINPQGHYVGFFRAPLDYNKLILTYESIRRSED